jgi:hypothetical protein
MGRLPDTPERYLVRQALLGIGADRPWLRSAARAVRSWYRVLDIARECEVAEPVWAGLTARRLVDEVPDEVRARFEEAQDRADMLNAIHLARAAAVQEAMDAVRIDSVLVGVGGILVAHYRDLGDRLIDRTVLLVRARDASAADAVVGRVRAHFPRPGQSGRGEDWPTFEMRFVEPSGERSERYLEACFEQSRRVAWDRRTLRVASAADLAACACVRLAECRDHAASPELADLAVAMGSGTLTWKEVEARMPLGTDPRVLPDARRLLDVGPRGGWADFRYALRILVHGA